MSLLGLFGGSYGAVYGVPGLPGSPLPVQVALNLGYWQDVTESALQREGTSAPIQISRGRPDERSALSASRMSLQLNNRAGQFTARNPSGPYYGLLGRNTGIRAGVPAAAPYLRLEDDGASFAAMPGSGVLGILAQDIRIDLTLTNWQPCTLLSWWGSSSQRAWIVLLNDDGTISFTWSNDGTTATLNTASSDQPLPLGPVVLRVTWDHGSGIATFYTAAPGNISAGPWTQLGDPSPGSGATTVSTSSAFFSIGYNSTADADFGGMPGLNGQVRDAQVLQAIGGTVLAQPAFSSQLPGYATWTDGKGNNWSLGGTAEISDRSFRYHGEMASLPQAWDATGKDVWVPLQARGIAGRIQQNSVNVPSPMYRYNQAATGVVAWWGCEETSGTQLSSGVPGGFPMQLSGHIALAADSGFPGSLPVAQIQSSTWQGLVGPYEDTGTIAFRLEAFLPGPLTADGGLVALLNTSGTARIMSLWWSPDALGGVGGQGQLFLNGFTSTLGNPWTFGNLSVSLAPGRYLISAELTSSGGNVTPVIRAMDLNGVVTTGTAGSYSGAAGTVSQVIINPVSDPNGTPGIGTGGSGGPLPTAAAGHVTVQNALVPLSQAGKPFLAWNGETAGNRFARLCSENGIQARTYGYPAASIPMGIQSAATLMTLLQECETTDGGIMFEPRQCLGLGYRTRQSMYNQAPAITLDYAASELGQTGQPGELTPTDDDQLLVNDILATRGSSGGSQGGTVRTFLDDGSLLSISDPPAGAGDYQDTPAYNLASDSQLPNRAGWALHVGTADDQRIPSFPLNLARTELAGLIYDLQETDFGDRVVVINPPAWLPPDDISQLVAGCTELIGGYWQSVAWNTVPESPWQVFTVADPVLGRIATGGSTLEMGISATALTFRAVSPGALWTTSAGDCPFDIAIGGERMTVSAVTGSSSPQVFTLSARSVNGVVKGHPANAPITLFQAAAVAL